MSLTGYRAWICDISARTIPRQKFSVLQSMALTGHIWDPNSKIKKAEHVNPLAYSIYPNLNYYGVAGSAATPKFVSHHMWATNMGQKNTCQGPGSQNWCECCGIYSTNDLETIVESIVNNYIITESIVLSYKAYHHKKFNDLNYGDFVDLYSYFVKPKVVPRIDPSRTKYFIFGKIKVWGWTVPHQFGNRSEYAQIEELYVAPHLISNEEFKFGYNYQSLVIANNLSRNYDVPVLPLDVEKFELYFKEGVCERGYTI